MDNYIFFDIEKSGYNIICAMFSEKTKTLMLCVVDSFVYADHKKITFFLRDKYPQIKRVRFIWDEHPLLPNMKTYVQRLKDVLFAGEKANYYVIGWNIEHDVLRFRQLDELGSIYAWNHYKKTETMKNVYAQNPKLVDIANLNAKSARNLELQALYQFNVLKDKPKIHEEGTEKDLFDIIDCATSRAIAIENLFMTPLYEGAFKTHRNLIERYGLVSKVPIGETSANIATEIITENGRKPLSDSNIISFDYPTAEGTINVLENSKLPEEAKEFYEMLEGRVLKSQGDLAVFYDDYAEKHGLASKTTTVNVEFEGDKGAYMTCSIGGAHGARTDSFEPFGRVKSTIEQHADVIAIDVDAYYPTLAVNLNIYGQTYADVLHERIALKKALPENRSEWTSEDEKNSLLVKDLKGILNPPTGKSNTFSPYARLPLDNKIISMRCIGNMLIYELAQKIIDCGTKLLFVNTDGIKAKLVNATEEDVRKTVDEFSQKYALSFKIEKLSRLIVKDCNNTVEWTDGKISKVTGKLGKGYKGKIPLDAKIDHPTIIDQAITQWFSQCPDWQKRPLGDARKFFIDYMTDKAERKNKKDWSLFLSNTDKQTYTIDGKPIKNAVACIMSKEGSEAKCLSNFKERKITGWTSNTLQIVENDKSLNIDVNAYVEWCMNTYRQWHVSNKQQMSIFDGKPKSKTTPKPEEPQKINKNSLLFKLIQETK